MFLTSLIILVQIGIALGNGQIYFPSDDDSSPYIPQRVQPTITYATRWKPASPNVETILSHTILKNTLDINRAVQITSDGISSTSNFAFGPVTIIGVMALALLASVGQTFNEIINFMGLNQRFNIENDNLEAHRQMGILSQKLLQRSGVNDMVSYKTAIFVQGDYPIRPEFQQAVDYFYQSDVVALNFKSYPEMSYNYINSWVSNSTNNKITSLLGNIPPTNTKAIIAGVLYFKGTWEHPFISGASNWAPFYVNGRTSRSDRKVMMMYNGAEFPYYKDKKLNVEIVGLPYKGRGTTMYLILPNESNVGKLRELENQLTPGDIERLINSTRVTEVALGLPKMKIESTVNLVSAMKYLGVRSLFDPRTANLALLSAPSVQRGFALVPPPSAPPPTTTPMPNLNRELIFARFGDQSDCESVYDFYTKTVRCRERRTRAASQDFLETLRREYQRYKTNPSQGNPGLYADQFIHKTFIEINEVGTEAAASSGVGISRSGKVTFKCDVPFLFFIYEEDAKVVLFWGSVKNPSPSISNY
ncbi:hypothetical protein FQR65_LT06295 [Abscondita terminalis]|nr:hypothetical protein FQR65_LT06295 [Abscondita terminalis]